MRFLVLCLLLLSFQTVFAQNTPGNFALRFNLEGYPTISDVGLENPKSYWKVKYWLRLVDKAESDKLPSVNADDEKAMAEFLKKKFKRSKNGFFLVSGDFKKNNLSVPENREFHTEIVLPDKVMNMVLKGDKFVFYLAIKSTIKSAIVKKKFKSSVEFPIELDFSYHPIFGATLDLSKENDGMFSLGIFVR